MNAPHIPNLLSLRGAGRGGRGRGGRRGGGGGGGPGGPRFASPGTGAAHDATIQGTDTDAAVSRLSAVDMGYLDDPYAEYFVQSAAGPPPRRLPIINRGTYTRTTALDRLVDSFLSSEGDGHDDGHDGGGGGAGRACPRQIVSLGAGTDTRPFRIYAESHDRPVIYHEVDFEVVCRRKLRTVQGNPRLASILTNPSLSSSSSSSEEEEEGSTTWTARPAGGEYLCHGLDLRRLHEADKGKDDGKDDDNGNSKKGPLIPGLRTDIPTLLISECCLCYLSPQEASGVLAYFTSRVTDLASVLYEPIRPHDAFGQVMVSNLAARRIRMPTLNVYREPGDQSDRLRAAGFETVRHMTIGDIWSAWVGPDEKERLDRVEGLDEVEEWQLLAAHYIVAWGSRGDGFGGWRSLPATVSDTFR